MEATESKKSKAEVVAVTMTDGRVVEFPGKKILQKSSFQNAETNKLYVRLDWRNGETRTFELPQALISKFATHGAEQKLGDEIAGMKKEDGSEADIDDKVMAVDDLIERLNAGEWSTQRDSSGMAGTSVLLRAIVEVTGKPVDAVKAFLKGKNQKQKLALRASKQFKDVVNRIEAERAAKSAKVDLEADGTMAELEAIPTA